MRIGVITGLRWELLALLGVAVVAVLCLVLLGAPDAWAQASDSNYGQRAGQWALDNLKMPWKAAVALGALAFLFPGVRKPAILAGFAIAVFVTGFLIFKPDAVQTMIQHIGKTIAG